MAIAVPNHDRAGRIDRVQQRLARAIAADENPPAPAVGTDEGCLRFVGRAGGDRREHRFQALASGLSELAGKNAALVAGAMNWLAERVREVKSVKPEVGYEWRKFPWDRWNEELTRAKDRLNDVSDALNAAVAQSATS